MVNWKEIHSDFTEKLQEEWEDKGFSYKQCKEWIDTGLKTTDADYAKWLRDNKKADTKWILNHGNNEQLRKEYEDYAIARWNSKEFNDEEMGKWISVGLGLQDGGYAAWMRDILKITPEEYPDRLDENNDDKLLREQWQIFLEERKVQKKATNEKDWKNIHPDFTPRLINSWNKNSFTYEDTEQWINIAGLQLVDAEFAKWLKDKEISPEWVLNHRENGGNIEDLKEEYKKHLGVKDNILINAQEWLDNNYPTPQAKANCRLLNIGVKGENNPWGLVGKHLAGSLSLQGFTNLKELICINQNITNLDLTDSVNLEGLNCDNNQLTHLDLKNQTKLTKLNCNANQLTELNVSAGSNLELLNCGANKLTKLDLTNYCQLTRFSCYENQLTQLIFPTKLPNLELLNCHGNLLTNLDFTALNEEKLTTLSLANNNFSTQDLTCLTRFINLKELYLGNEKQTRVSRDIANHWTGSLAPLQNMQQLQVLHISVTDLNSGTEYLPASIMHIDCSYLAKPDSKVKVELIAKELGQNSDFILIDPLNQTYFKKQLNPKILNQIKDFDHEHLTPEQETLLANLISSERWKNYYKANGLCPDCQQLNIESKLCLPCMTQILQTDFANWTSGNPEIDKFIQKCQLEATSPINLLYWMTYEYLTNIEHLADGGFGKVYKAKWTKWDNELVVALKSLNNSQNITSEFLAEIIHTKLAGKNVYGLIVPYIGISQDPITKNYLVIMEYMPEGNLREYLSKNYRKMKFEDKLRQLFTITQGLASIHYANLVHRDFHPGNVLVELKDNHALSIISDLGLSRPVNLEKGDGKIYGVLPYVAPEVLQGKFYTQASDIYSFGIVVYELLANSFPYYDTPYRNWDSGDEVKDELIKKIIKNKLRPNIDELKIPQALKDLIKRCWDTEPKQRPRAGELYNILSDWFDTNSNSIRKNTEFYQQYQALLPEIDLPTKPLFNHSADKYTSKPINTKEIAQLFQESREKALEKELKKIEQIINQPLTEEQKELVSDFIQVRKKMKKDRTDKNSKKEAGKLEEQLEEKGLSDENIEKVIKYCERFIKAEQQLEANIEIPTNQ